MTPSKLPRLSAVAFTLVLAVSGRQAAMAENANEKPEEQRDPSSTSLKLKRQSSSTQSQNSSGSPLGNALSDPGALFRTGEVQFLGYGTGGFGQATHNVTEEHTVKETITVTDTRLVPRTTYQKTFVPARFTPGYYVVTPVVTTVPVTTKRQVTKTTKVSTTKNVAGIQGGFGGAGAEARYFFTRWLGVGVEGNWLEGEGSSGTTLTTVTARLIRNSNAYYAFGGAGVQFNDDYTQAIGKLGLGVEHRFVAGTGVFADAAWMFGSQENAAVFRGGFRFAF